MKPINRIVELLRSNDIHAVEDEQVIIELKNLFLEINEEEEAVLLDIVGRTCEKISLHTMSVGQGYVPYYCPTFSNENPIFSVENSNSSYIDTKGNIRDTEFVSIRPFAHISQTLMFSFYKFIKPIDRTPIFIVSHPAREDVYPTDGMWRLPTRPSPLDDKDVVKSRFLITNQFSFHDFLEGIDYQWRKP